MLAGRFLMIIPLLALGGHLAAKKRISQSAGSFPVGGATFAVLLVGTVVLVGALTFLPGLALGADHRALCDVEFGFGVLAARRRLVPVTFEAWPRFRKGLKR